MQRAIRDVWDFQPGEDYGILATTTGEDKEEHDDDEEDSCSGPMMRPPWSSPGPRRRPSGPSLAWTRSSSSWPW
jgi:hypothetical protein